MRVQVLAKGVPLTVEASETIDKDLALILSFLFIFKRPSGGDSEGDGIFGFNTRKECPSFTQPRSTSRIGAVATCP